ncbi:SGNH/GDSL hydrolase family protein [Priestia megaterium]|nr:SGNH/GDSL hydrolase family protein [Priestia megaterium]
MSWKIGVNTGAAMFCGLVMYTGMQHWQEKIDVQASELVKPVPAEKKEKQFSDVSIYTKNLPPFMVGAIEHTFVQNKPISLVLVTATEADGWPSFVKTSLEETYGQDVFDVKVYSYHNQTTKQLISSTFLKDIQALNPSMILLEAPMAADQKEMPIDESLVYLNELIVKIKELNTGLMIQPSQPYASKHESYEEAVEAVKGTAEKNWVHYINHSKVWRYDVRSYLTKEGDMTKAGKKLWGMYLADWFVSE